MNKSISFICGDTRQIYLENLFNMYGYKTYVYDLSSPLLSKSYTKCTSLDMAISSSKYIVFPFRIDNLSLFQIDSIVHLLKNKLVFGGCIEKEYKNLFDINHINYFDFFKSDYVNKLNAISTAEGSIYYAIGNSTINIHNSNSLVIGYGNCGSVLAHNLNHLGSHVTVTTRSYYQTACAQTNNISFINISSLNDTLNHFDFIFNTAPSTILNKDNLDLLKKNCIIIDIASSPGGVDYEYARELGINAKLYPGIPGKISPKTSAKILYDYISMIIEDHF